MEVEADLGRPIMGQEGGREGPAAREAESGREGREANSRGEAPAEE